MHTNVIGAHKFAALLAVIAIGITPAITSAQARTSLVIASVTDGQSGQPLADAEVKLSDVNMSATTDWSGEARIAKVAGGQHNFEIRKAGYDPLSVTLLVQNHQLIEKLEIQVRDNLRLVTSLNELQDQALQAFALAIDAKDPSRRGHSPRVASYAIAIGQGLGMDKTAIAGLRAAGYLHDIGDMNIDKALFRKQSALHPEEFREIADHSILGYQIVRNVKFPWPEVAEVVRSHHERADGSGYPDRLRVDEVSLPVKIIAAADSFDAMLSDRPYRSSMPVKQALEDLVRATPQKYDASVVQALLVQLRREAEGRSEERLLPTEVETPSVREYDAYTLEILKKITNYRVYSA